MEKEKEGNAVKTIKEAILRSHYRAATSVNTGQLSFYYLNRSTKNMRKFYEESYLILNRQPLAAEFNGVIPFPNEVTVNIRY